MASNESKRLLSLDILRGLTIAGMIVVNSPGLDETYTWVAHADWNGWTPADLVFPSFLVIMGISLVISFGRRRERGESVNAMLWQVVRRTFIIFAFGLIESAVFYDFTSIHDFRVLGVLQRIALCYFACSLLYLFAGWEAQAGIMAALLLGYWALLTRVPVPGYGRGNLTADGNLASYLDRRILGAQHMMNSVEDPEGVLSTLPAIATSLMGVLAGHWIRGRRGKRRKVELLLAAGAASTAAGWLWGISFPLNKHIWTSSFVLFTGGIALLGLGLCYAFLDDDRGWKAWLARPLEVFGRNPLIAYFASGLFYGVQEFVPMRVQGAQGNLKLWLTYTLFAPWLSPRSASLAYALAYTGVCLGLMAILYRKRIFVKI